MAYYYDDYDPGPSYYDPDPVYYDPEPAYDTEPVYYEPEPAYYDTDPEPVYHDEDAIYDHTEPHWPEDDAPDALYHPHGHPDDDAYSEAPRDDYYTASELELVDDEPFHAPLDGAGDAYGLGGLESEDDEYQEPEPVGLERYMREFAWRAAQEEEEQAAWAEAKLLAEPAHYDDEYKPADSFLLPQPSPDDPIPFLDESHGYPVYEPDVDFWYGCRSLEEQLEVLSTQAAAYEMALERHDPTPHFHRPFLASYGYYLDDNDLSASPQHEDLDESELERIHDALESLVSAQEQRAHVCEPSEVHGVPYCPHFEVFDDDPESVWGETMLETWDELDDCVAAFSNLRLVDNETYRALEPAAELTIKSGSESASDYDSEAESASDYDVWDPLPRVGDVPEPLAPAPPPPMPTWLVWLIKSRSQRLPRIRPAPSGRSHRRPPPTRPPKPTKDPPSATASSQRSRIRSRNPSRPRRDPPPHLHAEYQPNATPSTAQRFPDHVPSVREPVPPDKHEGILRCRREVDGMVFELREPKPPDIDPSAQEPPARAFVVKPREPPVELREPKPPNIELNSMLPSRERRRRNAARRVAKRKKPG